MGKSTISNPVCVKSGQKAGDSHSFLPWKTTRKWVAILLTVLMVFLSAVLASAHTVSPVNPQATQATRDVLNWLAHLPNRIDNRVVSGFFGGYSNVTFSTTQLEELHNVTGQYPGIFGADYGAGWATASDPTTLIDYSCNDTLKTYWANGGLITINVCYPSPGYPDGGRFNMKLTNFEDLLNPNTETGQRWRAYLDKTAEGLADLRDAGVTVLWRPFHEMNGDWFWWGDQDTTTFKNVWIDMYNYFTNTKGLNNLIWVYAPDFGRGNRTAYYPGANYVDIVGLDVYDDNPESSWTLSIAYNEMIGLGKPFAFTEIGPDTCGTFDYSKWPAVLRQKYPKAVYFYAWNDQWAPHYNLNASALMNDAWTVNLGEINLASITEPVNILYDFEGSTQSWVGSNVSGGPWSVTEWYYSCGYSLKADVNLLSGTKDYWLYRRSNHNLSGYTYLKARVKHAPWGYMGSGMVALLYIKTGNNWAWYDSGFVQINSSGATTLTLPLSGVANLNYVREIGVVFVAPVDAIGVSSVYVDYVTLE